MRYLLSRFRQTISSRLWPINLWIFVSGLCLSTAILAQGTKSGGQVYNEVCFVCHATGVQNAPKFGDRAAWSPLFKEGQYVVTAHGWVGQGGMPPRGGKTDLSLDEFARAVVYMARASGGDWKDPDAAMLDRIRKEEKKRIKELKAKK